MIEKKMLIAAYDFFDSENIELKRELEIEDMLVDIACEFIKYRAANNITQKELAEKLGMTQAMVSKLESGDYNPTVKMLFEIAQKLDWKFNLKFTCNNESDNYQYPNTKEEQSHEYFENMGFAS